MDDEQIVALYWQRDESAISATAEKYGGYCGSIAWQVLSDAGEVEECLNDTWLHAWNAIPPHRPQRLAVFLGKITRELAFDRWRASHRQKRGGGELPLALEELEEVAIASHTTPEEQLIFTEMGDAISRFLRTEPPRSAKMFIRRYYFLAPYRQIASEFGIKESGARLIVFRVRKRLRSFLEKEGLL